MHAPGPLAQRALRALWVAVFSTRSRSSIRLVNLTDSLTFPEEQLGQQHSRGSIHLEWGPHSLSLRIDAVPPARASRTMDQAVREAVLVPDNLPFIAGRLQWCLGPLAVVPVVLVKTQRQTSQDIKKYKHLFVVKGGEKALEIEQT